MTPTGNDVAEDTGVLLRRRMVAVVPASPWGQSRGIEARGVEARGVEARGVEARGIEAREQELRRAMTEDVVEVVSGLDVVEPVLVLGPQDPPDWAELVWPGTPVRTVAGRGVEVLTDLHAHGATMGAVVAGDAPDLPGLLVGKCFRALSSAQVSVCPAADGTLVVLAAHLPVPGWLAATGVGLDSVGAVGVLFAAAPNRRAFSVGPGWHRIRGTSDFSRLDPNLEGWEQTRHLLRSGLRGGRP